MDLFEAAQRGEVASSDPLADRMRPTQLDEVVGQEQIFGKKSILRRLIEADRVPSLILWGPPGSGKTTIARLVATMTQARFESISAVLSGVADLRKVLAEAKRCRLEHRERTILFVDEIHRWSKSQQDALLDAVERGTVTLIGATTENPSFELNAALLSRARVFVLKALDEEDLVRVMRRAIVDPDKGLGRHPLEVQDDALAIIAKGSHGDARRALSVLEIAAQDALLLAEPGGPCTIAPAAAEEALQHRTLLYDKAGDEHYGVVSAFIKSMRGSDPDAAAYYLVRMLEGGEDPRFILRRMVIFASEDVGNADPQALQVAINALQSYEFIGLPEGVLPMTQAVTYLACAPKSNTALTTYSAARRDVKELGPLSVPKKLLNAVSGLQKAMGHGREYRYPHDLGGLAAGEDYLPEQLAGRQYYTPTDDGYEATIRERLDEIRRANAETQVPTKK